MLAMTTLEAINVSRNPLPAKPGRRFVSKPGHVTTYATDGSTKEQPFQVVKPWEPGE
jgi:hypothetical protein